MTTNRSVLRRLSEHPIAIMTALFVVATGIAMITGMPIHRITQIAVYTL